ncbi:hypothetical protein GN956_G25218 [Arapaima gigas]
MESTVVQAQNEEAGYDLSSPSSGSQNPPACPAVVQSERLEKNQSCKQMRSVRAGKGLSEPGERREGVAASVTPPTEAPPAALLPLPIPRQPGGKIEGNKMDPEATSICFLSSAAQDSGGTTGEQSGDDHAGRVPFRSPELRPPRAASSNTASRPPSDPLISVA